MATSLEESRRRATEKRVTLRNYLDMSKSLNLEPGSNNLVPSSKPGNRPPVVSRSHQRFDMSKSLNVDSGYFKSGTATGSRIETILESEQDILHSHRSSRRNSLSVPGSERVSNASSTDASSLFHAGFRNKVLPTSPNLVDSLQEQQLIDAFVDQLKNLATSSSSGDQNRRRAVRRALEYPPPEDIPKAKVEGSKPRFEVTVVAASPKLELCHKPDVSRGLDKVEVCATVAQACRNHQPGVFMVDTMKMKTRVVRNGHDRQRMQRQMTNNNNNRAVPLPRIEEKQTVISSPISHNALTTPAFKMRLKSADMAPAIQQHAVERALQILKGMDKLNARLVASQLKKEFDKIYGPAWHCIVGTSFGSYVTHSVGGFIYFAVGKVSILLFRTAIQVVQAK